MKVSYAILAGTMLLSGSAFAKEVTETLQMSGWHCSGCGDKTASAVMKLKETKKDDTLKATADVKAATLTITFDDAKVTKADIEEAVKATKYKVVGWK